MLAQGSLALSVLQNGLEHGEDSVILVLNVGEGKAWGEAAGMWA